MQAQALFEDSNILDFPQRQKSNEWYTPARYIEAAREVMGGIDLDPASCELANRTVRATRYYTKEENGLAKPWHGRVWLNPPFGRKNAPPEGFGGGKSIMGMFIGKLVREHEEGNVKQAILLATPKVDTAWFQPLWQYLICFSCHRVLFTRPGDADQGHFYGTVFVYLGPHEQRFIDIFSEFGRIAKAIDTPKARPIMPTLWEDA